VPEAIIAFLESRDFTHAVQCAISIGGDSDTLAAITGGIAEAFYGQNRIYGGIPGKLIEFAKTKMNIDMINVIFPYYHKDMEEKVARFIEAVKKRKNDRKKQGNKKEPL
jgi:ADP-ribosylglycohydrolase